ncbi:hypothetical protein TWF225_004683 [Orbilia oligospora]|uniref:Uncharacterized protein n=1 Tax=Orbilia oligospora TaxID=2813651 RepID=A0A7C8PBQ6_ORBOL|nr:hypothetical protein TWF751_006993 [Orbilia oligospora]KAF3186637.1 hypothetical protein TWF225_004683 [Orbilia oligospora]KAF3246315.1 hypothetical protein TWF217_009986 [Orbilia oligospora]KAF3266121.1 hypothetical protein TWF128_011654 [Orbilia oligospora]KAF3296791.1 hypothetical protein TWF132_009301 [Orbilia oligospora]
MKATLILAIFAAAAAAAPQGAIAKRQTQKRCGADSGLTCATGETCVGEFGFKDDPKGVCIKGAIKCGSTPADPNTTCPKDKSYKCIPRANTLQCPMDVAYCGFCVEKAVTDIVGVRSEGVNRCGGKSGKKCFENPSNLELCAGEEALNDGMGVCLSWGLSRNCQSDADCNFPGSSSQSFCVTNTCPKGLGPEECTGKVCLDEKYIRQFGLSKF